MCTTRIFFIVTGDIWPRGTYTQRHIHYGSSEARGNIANLRAWRFGRHVNNILLDRVIQAVQQQPFRFRFGEIVIGSRAECRTFAARVPVRDETHIAGRFDFKLDWEPDLEPSTIATNPSLGPSIFSAITDQLGLRLESAKGPVQTYVIDRITVPTENQVRR
jgi:uncharacterized protein (TIGR03435 family)